MIDFNCPQCNALFSVPDNLAGRRARCKKCATPLTIPKPELLAALAAAVESAAGVGSSAGAASAMAGDGAALAGAMAQGSSESSAIATVSETVTATVTAAATETNTATAVATAPVAATTVSATNVSATPVAAAPVAAAPTITAPAPPPPPALRLPPRLRRLRADFEQMNEAFENFPLIKVRTARGEPPEVYELEYFLRGLERIAGRQEPVERSYHLVEIRLTGDYPRMSPQCKMLTPIFHPNIEPATICVGDYWTAGERLVDLAIRIGELITYQAYNIKSPLDAEAAMWADLHMRELPIDDRNLRPPELD
ncbi:MAG TPA: ubiquitin-conjugating enzyme E2 [Tepidisphaeraceae bacterium]|nr:ubiquitin-conjugating enzyme E2 [Tepidisphaeraceae bacterium]